MAADRNQGWREAALTGLVERHRTALVRMCCLCLGDASLAEDAAQETFLKAYRALDSFRGECDEKTWLMRIAINTCRDMRRSRWTRHVDRRVTPEMLPEASAPFEERDEELTLAQMRLPPKQREAVLLRYYQRMSLAQTAQAMGVTVSTVSKQLGRALRSLRGILEGGREHEWKERIGADCQGRGRAPVRPDRRPVDGAACAGAR